LGADDGAVAEADERLEVRLELVESFAAEIPRDDGEITCSAGGVEVRRPPRDGRASDEGVADGDVAGGVKALLLASVVVLAVVAAVLVVLLR
jgi:hypothetical protein